MTGEVLPQFFVYHDTIDCTGQPWTDVSGLGVDYRTALSPATVFRNGATRAYRVVPGAPVQPRTPGSASHIYDAVCIPSSTERSSIEVEFLGDVADVSAPLELVPGP